MLQLFVQPASEIDVGDVVYVLEIRVRGGITIYAMMVGIVFHACAAQGLVDGTPSTGAVSSRAVGEDVGLFGGECKCRKRE